MKALFDTSVLVAAFVVDHPYHSVCFPYFQDVRSGNTEGYLTTHCLAELYGTLTTKVRPLIAPVDVRRMMNTNLAFFQVMDLDSSDYLTVIDNLVALALTGAVIYDALHAYAAHKKEVDIILTLNSKDFTRLGEDIAQKVVNPSAV